MTTDKKFDINVMLNKLNTLYDKEEQLLKQLEFLRVQYIQLKEDIEMLQNMIMYASNKNSRR